MKEENGKKWHRPNKRMGKGRHTKEVTREGQQEDSMYSEPTGEEESDIENEISSLGQKQLRGKRKGVQAWRQIRHEEKTPSQIDQQFLVDHRAIMPVVAFMLCG